MSQQQQPIIRMDHILPPETWDRVFDSIDFDSLLQIRATGSQYLKNIADQHRMFSRDMDLGTQDNILLFARRCGMAAGLRRPLSLTIDLEFSSYNPTDDARERARSAYVSDVVSLILRVQHIIRHLRISIGGTHFGFLQPFFLRTAPKLESLRLSATSIEPQWLPGNMFLGQAPQLTYLALYDISFAQQAPQLVSFPSVKSFVHSSHGDLYLPLGLDALLPGLEVLALTASQWTTEGSTSTNGSWIASSAGLKSLTLDFSVPDENARLCLLLHSNARHVEKVFMSAYTGGNLEFVSFKKMVNELDGPLSLTLGVEQRGTIEVTYTELTVQGGQCRSRTLRIDLDSVIDAPYDVPYDIDDACADIESVLALVTDAALAKKVAELRIDIAAGTYFISECLDGLPKACTLVLSMQDCYDFDWMRPCNSHWSTSDNEANSADVVMGGTKAAHKADPRLQTVQLVRFTCDVSDDAMVLRNWDLEAVATLIQRMPHKPLTLEISEGVNQTVTARLSSFPNAVSNMTRID